MARALTENQLLRKAIEAAVLDREAMVDCYGGVGLEADEARQCIKDMRALKNRRFSALNEAERHVAFSIFVYAEQYEGSLADAQSDPQYRLEARSMANQFRAVRLRYWGKSALENALETGERVTVQELFRRMKA